MKTIVNKHTGKEWTRFVLLEGNNNCLGQGNNASDLVKRALEQYGPGRVNLSAIHRVVTFPVVTTGIKYTRIS